MKAFTKRLDYLFRSTRGLTLVAIAVVSLIAAIWGTLSGPMVEWAFGTSRSKYWGWFWCRRSVRGASSCSTTPLR